MIVPAPAPAPARFGAWGRCRAGWRTAALLLVGLLAASLTACTGSNAPDDRTPTRSEIGALLTRHGTAVRDRDQRAFLADLADGAYRNRQRAMLANLADVPLSAWSYSIGPRVDDESAQRRARTVHGASAVIFRVSLTYGLRGIDSVPTPRDLWWTFVRHDGRAAVVADTDLAVDGAQSWRGPWDFGALRVAAGRSSLVLAHVSDADLLPTLVADVDRAVPAVTGVVGTGWGRRVAVLVPASSAERDIALGAAASGSAQVGAVATSDGVDPQSQTVLGQRVVVVADQFRTLTQNGARLVLQHEITHVATAKLTTAATPTWLAEGFADYVGYLGNERPVRTAAAELAAQVRRGGVPAALPDSAAFAAASTSAAAYQLSWLACRRIAAQYGRATLLRFYVAVGAATEPSGPAVVDAARTVLGETPTQFTARLRTYVAGQLQ